MEISNLVEALLHSLDTWKNANHARAEVSVTDPRFVAPLRVSIEVDVQ